MSKRTTASKTASTTTPTPRRRAAKPADEAATAAPKAPRTRRKTTPSETINAVTADVVAEETRRPSHDEIARRAYFIALERGFSNDPLADWLLAERELTTA